MTLIGMWLGVALAQPLMVRKVQVVTRRQVLTRAPVDSQGLPSVEPATLAPEERGDLEALSERFRQRARALGFGALVPGPERPGVPTGVPAWPVGVIAAQVARAGPLTTWTLTANALTTERVGRGCCAPCPCGPSGCAPCAVCEERGCRAVVRGVQLVVTSTVEARALRREVVLAQTVDAAEPPAAAPPWVVRVEGPLRLDPQVVARVRSRGRAFEACSRFGGAPQCFSVRALASKDGRLEQVAASVDETPAVACVLLVVRSMRLGALEAPAPLAVAFERAAP